MNASAPSRLYSLRQAAQFLGIGVKTLRGLIADGKISTVRASSRSKVFVDLIDLEGYIATHSCCREEVKEG